MVVKRSDGNAIPRDSTGRRVQAGRRGRQQIVNVRNLAVLGAYRAVVRAGTAQLRSNKRIIFTLYTGDVHAVTIIAITLKGTVRLRQYRGLT